MYENTFVEDNGELAALGMTPGRTVTFEAPGVPPASGGRAAATPRPWHMALTYTDTGTSLDAVATFTYCHLMLGPILKTYITGTTNVDLSAGTTGDHVIFARLTPARALDIIGISNLTSGADRFADLVLPTDGMTRIPLYRVTRAAATDSWRIVLDYRDMSLNQYI